MKTRMLRVIAKQKRRMPYVVPYQDPIVHIIGMNDPYALLTLANSPTYYGNEVVMRIVSDLFFDQQCREFLHSSDGMSMLLVLYLFHLKSSLEKQRE
jgi:hypothetical protein